MLAPCAYTPPHTGRTGSVRVRVRVRLGLGLGLGLGVRVRVRVRVVSKKWVRG
jgi:hypothetical protein